MRAGTILTTALTLTAGAQEAHLSTAVSDETKQPQLDRLLSLPPRFMWGWGPGLSGYCGSVSLQTSALFYGNWLTEDYVRGTSGGHTGDHQMYVSYPEDLPIPQTALIEACYKVKLNCSMWNYHKAPEPQHEAFLRWAADGIDNNFPVILGLFWSAEATPHSNYDHIVPMVGYAPSSESVSGVDAVFFNDLHANTTTRTQVKDFVKTRSECNSTERFGPQSFCLPDFVNYGLQVRGNLQERPTANEVPLRPVRLVMSNWTEPDYSTEDKMHEKPTLLSAQVLVSGLSAGKTYALLRFDDPEKTPVSDFLNSPHIIEKNVFVATAATARFERSFMSNSTQLFRCVESAP